ncbi:larval cuticle protein LCP-17 [Drosophila miranda]|uniref:larval cuticle protein LCP-17 n=1 Tax=Drosophila miranda TaxID=7229 RepID=UPI0007E642A0|nr:larval cuticle protein LCP-17 [Drosophila miranda]
MFALWLIFACCCCCWPAESVSIGIVKSLAEQQSDGSYFFAYEAANGNYREEVGIVKEDDLEVSGVYRYLDDSGQKVEVSYMADKNGFVPRGFHIEARAKSEKRREKLHIYK